MTVTSTTTPKIQYTGNGSTTVFTVPYEFINATDLLVILTDTNQNDTTQVITTNYTVSGGNSNTGSITMLVAPPSGYTLTIIRQTPQTQGTSYPDNGEFPASSHEAALDKLTLEVQDLNQKIGGVLSLKDSSTLSNVTVASSPSAFLQWSADQTTINAVLAASIGSYIFPAQNGLLAQNATSEAVARTITGTTNQIDITNGDGILGNPTITISATYPGQTSITTLGTIATGTWNGSTISLSHGGTGTDLSATGGTHQVLKQSTVGGTITVGQLAASDISGLATSATTDTTSATNITSGTLATARLASIPAFAATGTSFSVVNATYSLCGYSSVVFDNLSNYTNTTGNFKFTAPVAGIYRVHADGYFSGLGTSAHNYIIAIYKNGSAYKTADWATATVGQNYMTINSLMHLNANDYIQIYVNQDSGGTLSFFLGEFNASLVSN